MAGSTLYSIRIGAPLAYHSKRHGSTVRTGLYGQPGVEDVAWADTVVLQRETDQAQLLLVERLQGMGKRVVFDIDDYLLQVPPYLAVHKHCEQMRPSLEAMLRLVDAVSVSTEPLREQLLRFNPNVFVTPNHGLAEVSATALSSIEHFASDQPIRILIASSDSARVDFLIDALRIIVARENVELIGIGPPGEALRAAGLAAETAPLMNHQQFKAFIAATNNSIALIPLDENPFNRCKSAIKFFDYALAGVPCVCSRVTPYQEVISHNVSGLLAAEDTAHWVNAVSRLISNPQLRTRIAAAAHQKVRSEHTPEHSADAWQVMLTTTPRRRPDPAYRAMTNPLHRTRWQLVRATLRHVLRAQSWKTALRLYKKEGFSRLIAKWKLLF